MTRAGPSLIELEPVEEEEEMLAFTHSLGTHRRKAMCHTSRRQPSDIQEERASPNTYLPALVMDCWFPELWENKFLLLEPPNLCYIDVAA